MEGHLANKAKIIRRPNFTHDETKVLVEEYRNNAKELSGKFSTSISGPSKKAIWIKITQKVNAIGGNNRTTVELMKKYKNIKTETKKIEGTNRKSFKKTGGGTPEYEALDDIQQTVASTLSRTAIEGIEGGLDLYDDNFKGLMDVSFKLAGDSERIVSISDDDDDDIIFNGQANSEKGENTYDDLFRESPTRISGYQKPNETEKNHSYIIDKYVTPSQMPSSSSGFTKKANKLAKDKDRMQVASQLKTTPSSTKVREERISTPGLLKTQVNLLEEQVNLFKEIRDELRIGNQLKREMIEIEKEKLTRGKSKDDNDE